MPYPIGRTIVGVRWMKQSEVQQQGWWYTAPTIPVLELDDGSILWAAQDDEGDAGGCIFGRKNGNQFIVNPSV